MRAETYASECCGALFIPGFGDDNIVEKNGSDLYDAVRDGFCPACGAPKPDMMEVFVVTDRDRDHGLAGGSINP